MMKSAITAALILLGGILNTHAEDYENDYLHGRWVVIESADQIDDMLGLLSWESITFSTNHMVEWSWTRDGAAEKHAGNYEIVPDRDEPIYSRLRRDINLHPDTLAVRRPVILKNFVVCLDNRFPQSWQVLKWGFANKKATTLLREDHAAEWEQSDTNKKANNRLEATAPLRGSPAPQPNVGCKR